MSVIQLARDLVSAINEPLADIVDLSAQTRGLPAEFRYAPILELKDYPTKGPNLYVAPGVVDLDTQYEDVCDRPKTKTVFVCYSEKLTGVATDSDVAKDGNLDEAFNWVTDLFCWIAKANITTFGIAQEIEFINSRSNLMYEWEWLKHHRMFMSMVELTYDETT